MLISYICFHYFCIFIVLLLVYVFTDYKHGLQQKSAPLSLDTMALALSLGDEWRPGIKSHSLIFSSTRFCQVRISWRTKYVTFSILETGDWRVKGLPGLCRPWDGSQGPTKELPHVLRNPSFCNCKWDERTNCAAKSLWFNFALWKHWKRYDF